MKWEVGKTYRSRNGVHYILQAFAPDGRLIVQMVGAPATLRYRKADGTPECTDSECNGKCMEWDLINPDEPTDEEREKIAKIFELFNMNGSADAVRKDNSLGYTRNIAARVLEILREGR